MRSKSKKQLLVALCLLAAFALWTVLVCTVDVQRIGPLDSAVGLASLNGPVRDLVGVRMPLYTLTDWLGLVPIATALSFAILGLVQWIKRKGLLRVDRDILALGVFYIAVMAVYLLFETVTVNTRPVLIDGRLETSYPSSTTLLTACVMPAAALQLFARMRRGIPRLCLCGGVYGFTAFMVIGRLLSGVHWFTDIVGGLLLSGGLVMLYAALGMRPDSLDP